MSSIWTRLALALVLLGVASFGVAAVTYDAPLSGDETPLASRENPEGWTVYAYLGEGIDHDFFLGGGAAFLISAALLGTFALRRHQ